MLALEFGWTKTQVDAEPRDYIREIIIALRARHDRDIRKANEGKAEQKALANQARR